MAMYKSSPSGLVDVNSTRQSKGTVYFSHAMSMQSSQPPSALQYAAAEPTGARSVMSTQEPPGRLGGGYEQETQGLGPRHVGLTLNCTSE